MKGLSKLDDRPWSVSLGVNGAGEILGASANADSSLTCCEIRRSICANRLFPDVSVAAQARLDYGYSSKSAEKRRHEAGALAES